MAESESVVPAWRVGLLFGNGTVEIDAASEPCGVGTQDQSSVVTPQRLNAWLERG